MAGVRSREPCGFGPETDWSGPGQARRGRQTQTAVGPLDCMHTDAIDDAGSRAHVLDAWTDAARAALTDAGAGAVREATDAEAATLEAIQAGEIEAISLETVAGVLACAPDQPDADVIDAEARDRLLMGMTRAVLDVDRLARLVETDRTATELQQAIEGRAPLPMGEFASLRAAIAQES